MSRCFPFPPPGYEKKPRPDDANLLIKEKNKEKKHKKEKKDKEKKERKEKKDKERSEEKCREKKEKKHKHKDQKDEETDKEKKVLGILEHQNSEKPSPTGIQGTDSQPVLLLELEKGFRNNNGATESQKVGKIVAADQGTLRFQGKVTQSNFDFLSNEKFKEKRDDHRMVNGQTLKVVARGLENGVIPNVMGEDRKKIGGGVFQVEKVNDKPKERKEKKKHKSRDGKGDKHQDKDQIKQNKSKDRKGEKQKEKEEKAIEERSKEQIKQSSNDTVEIHGNGPSYLLNESSRSKGNIGKRKEPEKEKEKEEKAIEERSKEQIKRSSIDKVEIHGNGPSYLLNESNRSKGSLGKRKEPEKEKEKEKANEERSKEQIKQSSVDTVDIHGGRPSYLLKESSRSKGNLGKRKDPETNGVLYDDGSRSNELSRPVSSSHQVMQNGSKYGPSQSVVQFAVERQATMQDHNVNAKVPFPQSDLGNGRKLDPSHIVNGFMSGQKITVNNHKVRNSLLLSQPVGGTSRKLESDQAAVNSTDLGPGVVSNHKLNNNISSSQPDGENQTRSNGSQAIIHTTAERQGTFDPLKVDDKKHMINGLIKTEKSKKTKEKFETHKRPPHPDFKYLSHILTVPEVEWSDFDDQEWLFSSSDSKAKKPRTVSTQIEETKMVWAEALPMESADVVALPYVIPY